MAPPQGAHEGRPYDEGEGVGTRVSYIRRRCRGDRPVALAPLTPGRPYTIGRPGVIIGQRPEPEPGVGMVTSEERMSRLEGDANAGFTGWRGMTREMRRDFVLMGGAWITVIGAIIGLAITV